MAPPQPGSTLRGLEGHEQPPMLSAEEFFERLSEKVANQARKAASAAGTKATRGITQKLTATLDEAIAEAMRAADTVGTLVRKEVHAAIDDALRNAVMDAMRARGQHMAQLAVIDRTVQSAQDLASVRLRLDAELKRSGLVRITEASPDLFDLVNPDEHPDSQRFDVLTPAYVESGTGRTVQRGEVRRLPAAEPVGRVIEDKGAGAQ